MYYDTCNSKEVKVNESMNVESFQPQKLSYFVSAEEGKLSSSHFSLLYFHFNTLL